MDMNITKHSVAVNETIFSQTFPQPLDISISLPDYCPDIVSILKCRVTPFISSKTVNEHNVLIEGTAAVNIIYTAENGCLRSIEYIYPFSKSVDVKVDCTDACVLIAAKSEYINCRAISKRKADVHGSISLSVKVICKKESQILVDVDLPHIQVDRKKIKNTNCLACNERYFVIDEEFALDSSKEAAQGILRHDLHTSVKDCKIIGNKAVVKGEATLDILYYSLTEKLCSFCETVPFSQIVEMDASLQECDCTVKIEIASQDVRVQNAGETNSGFYLNARLCATVSACCDEEISLIVDAFSTDYETQLEQNNISFECIKQSLCEKFLCKKNVELGDVTVAEIVDFKCEAGVTNTQLNNGQLTINGVALICVMFIDRDGEIHYSEKPVDFKYCCDVNFDPQDFRCEPEILALASSYNITGDNCIEARVELCVTAGLYEVRQQMAVCDVTVLENERKKSSTRGALIIYYAKSSESIWSIARKYNTSPIHIKQVNSLEDDLLCEDKTLLIPCK